MLAKLKRVDRRKGIVCVELDIKDDEWAKDGPLDVLKLVEIKQLDRTA